jgi:hypothetical protein
MSWRFVVSFLFSTFLGGRGKGRILVGSFALSKLGLALVRI